jgi:hypothetical protein
VTDDMVSKLFSMALEALYSLSAPVLSVEIRTAWNSLMGDCPGAVKQAYIAEKSPAAVKKWQTDYRLTFKVRNGFS